ncbi:MAG: hypothetical protein ABIP17_06865 [Ilumatobacteraceae bacterium]
MNGRINAQVGDRIAAATFAVTLAVLASGCGRETELVSPQSQTSVATTATTAPDAQPVVATSTSATVPLTTPSTVPSTLPLTVPSTSPPGTVPPSTAASTSPPDTSTAPTTPSPDSRGPAPATAFTVDRQDLLERDVASGATVRVVTEGFAPDATYPVVFALTPDRSQLYFAEAIEDSWYSCETSAGSVFVADLATGERTYIGPGWAPAIDSTGTHLAYIEASQCLPDPTAPEMFVLTPYDTVVVIDLMTGARTDRTLAVLPTAEDDPNALTWVGFDIDGSLLASTWSGAVHRLDPSALTDIGSAPVVADIPGLNPVATAGSALIVMSFGDEGSSDVFRIDPASPTPSLMVSSESFVSVGVSAGGHVIVAYDDALPPPVLADASVTLLPVTGLYTGIDW